MLAIRNFGEKSLTELQEKLREKGYLKEKILKITRKRRNNHETWS